MSFFDSAFTLVIGSEGGYVNDPADPGGETKYGISKRVYPNEDILNLSLERAKAIYLKDYWNALGCDSLAWGPAYVLFDCAVNQGVGAARALKEKAQQGPGFVVDFLALRAMRYCLNPQFARYGHGWLSRLLHVLISASAAP